jgi:hypothetical protein
MGDIAAHDHQVHNSYVIHYPDHAPREGDPQYKDFNAYHRKTRKTARCHVGQRIGYESCKDAQGNPCPPAGDSQPGLELHHAHIEFALLNGVSLTALEMDYPGVSDPESVGKWVESAENLRWLCVHHHRGLAGAHKVAHSDWEGSRYINGLIS